MKLKLGKLGTADAEIPKSMALCSDFVNIWVSQPNAAQIYRLHAAAMGACAKYKLPAYPVQKGDPVGYGFVILDRLLEAGVSPESIYEQGGKLLEGMLKKVSFNYTKEGEESEVKQQEDFS